MTDAKSAGERDIVERLGQRAFSWGPSQSHYVGHGLSMATADLRREIMDRDCADASEEILTLRRQLAEARNAALEEAACVLDVWAGNFSWQSDDNIGLITAIKGHAARIRALKAAPPENVE
jgi:hypothetical protein